MSNPVYEVTTIVEPFASIAYAGKELGNVDKRFGEGDYLENRERFLRHLEPAKYVLEVVRGKPEFLDISDVADDDIEDSYVTDGLFINRPGIALGLNTADCNAITMYDYRQGGVLGMIHAGRQGVDGDIHLASLDNLTGKHGVAVEDVRIHFAPSIRKDSYRFPHKALSEVFADKKWQKYTPFFVRDGTHHVDLVGRIVQEFTEAGVQPDQMVISPIDTFVDPQYFSHQRSCQTGEAQGRNGVVAMLTRQVPPAELELAAS